MGGFIDPDELKIAIVEEGQRSKRYKIGETWELNWIEIEKVIDNATTVDAVEVVRCRDCKHFERAYYKKDGTENFKYKRGVCCRKNVECGCLKTGSALMGKGWKNEVYHFGFY